MKSPYNFIVKPLGDTYNNTKDISGVKLVINTSMESAKHVNRIGIVAETPIYYNGDILPGDKVIIHHNVFRKYYDMKGRQTHSPEYFSDGVYIINPDRIYMYNRDDEWKSNDDYCFIRPIDRVQDSLLHSTDKEESHKGVLVYPSKYQSEKLGLNKGDVIAFKKNSEYAFDIEDEKLYRMRETDVVMHLN